MNLKTLLSTSLVASLGFTLWASPASDNAGNYSLGFWVDGGNEGSGFGAWDLTDNNNDTGNEIFAGYFLGESTDGAGNINTSGQSFGIYANPGSAFATAQRNFDSAMSVGETFSVDLGVNFDNGNKGFNLFNTTQGEIFNFNVGSGASVTSSNATVNSTTATYDYGGNDAALFAEITVDSATQLSYRIDRSSSQGAQGTLFSGTITGLTSTPDALAFYNSGTDDGSNQNNLYFNNLQIIPEPETALLLLFGLSGIAFLRKRK